MKRSLKLLECSMKDQNRLRTNSMNSRVLSKQHKLLFKITWMKLRESKVFLTMIQTMKRSKPNCLMPKVILKISEMQ
jgi:hypothetical protein